MKKNNIKFKNNDVDLSFLQDYRDIICDVFIKEKIIDFKKVNGIELTGEEFFFDNYLLKPSILYNLIDSKLNDDNIGGNNE